MRRRHRCARSRRRPCHSGLRSTIRRSASTAPLASTAPRTSADVVASEASFHAEETVRLVAALLEEWGREGGTIRRTGGVSARALARTADALDLEADAAARIIEIAAAAGLLGLDDDGATWVPSSRAAGWLTDSLPQRWAPLALAWSASARTPWLTGTRDDDGTLRAVLSPDLEAGWAARLRARVLALLGDLPPGTSATPAFVRAALTWQSPRRTIPGGAISAVLAEAETLGITGGGALTEAGRILARRAAASLDDQDTGLSGGPGGYRIVGVVSWSSGALQQGARRTACGGFTAVTPTGEHAGWINARAADFARMPSGAAIGATRSDWMAQFVRTVAAAGLAQEGTTVRFHLLANNTDSAGHTYGCHESYSVPRSLLDVTDDATRASSETAMAVLTSFLATRPVLVGSGRPLAGGPTEPNDGSRGAGEEAAWGLSPRAPHLQALTSADTTGQRALVNTRDEPHADAARWRRLHVINGDANRFEVPIYLKVATTDLLLWYLERSHDHRFRLGLVPALAERKD